MVDNSNFYRYRVLAQSAGMVNGSMFTLGGAYGLQRYNSLASFQSNGMNAPSLLDLIYNLYLCAAFGATGDKSVIITPVTDNDTETAKEVENTLNEFIQIQSKIAKMGRIYLEFGEIIVKVSQEYLGTENPIKFYDILENPYEVKRIEYKERLVGYIDSTTGDTLNAEEILYIHDRHSYSSRPIEISVKTNRVETEAEQTPLTADVQSLSRYRKRGNTFNNVDDIKKVQAKEVFGISKLANSLGLLDLYPNSLADGINNITQYRPKTIVTVGTGEIKDVSQRNDAFNKVVNSAKSVGSVQYIEVANGVEIGVTQVVESQQSSISEELDFKLTQAAMFSYLSADILRGEKSIFEDPNAVAIIKDIRGAVAKIVGDIIKSEFGSEVLGRVRIKIKSNMEREWEAAADALLKSVELMSSVSDMASLNRKKLKPGALSYFSTILGVEFNEIMEDMTQEEIDKLEKQKEQEDF